MQSLRHRGNTLKYIRFHESMRDISEKRVQKPTVVPKNLRKTLQSLTASNLLEQKTKDRLQTHLASELAVGCGYPRDPKLRFHLTRASLRIVYEVKFRFADSGTSPPVRVRQVDYPQQRWEKVPQSGNCPGFTATRSDVYTGLPKKAAHLLVYLAVGFFYRRQHQLLKVEIRKNAVGPWRLGSYGVVRFWRLNINSRRFIAENLQFK
jgi:hypothetical protein